MANGTKLRPGMTNLEQIKVHASRLVRDHGAFLENAAGTVSRLNSYIEEVKPDLGDKTFSAKVRLLEITADELGSSRRHFWYKVKPFTPVEFPHELNPLNEEEAIIRAVYDDVADSERRMDELAKQFRNNQKVVWFIKNPEDKLNFLKKAVEEIAKPTRSNLLLITLIVAASIISTGIIAALARRG